MKTLIIYPFAACCMMPLVLGSTVVYESFSGAAANLHGATGGTGLSGTWNATEGTYPMTVASGTATYGTLSSTGNRALLGYNPSGSQVNSRAFINSGTTLHNAGLMADGTSLWVSFLFSVPTSGGTTNSNFAFALGDASVSTTAGMGGNAVGFEIGRHNRPNAVAWSSGVGVARGATGGTTNPNFTAGATNLIVAEIVWGGTTDTINLYLPDTDLSQPVTYSTATSLANIDQANAGFNVISFGGKNAIDSPAGVDEIRFGASYADVVPVPEPSSAILLCIGALGLLHRRRRE